MTSVERKLALREAQKRYIKQHFFRRKAIAANSYYGSKLTAEELAALWKKQRGRCWLTKEKLNRENAELDHITPRSKGGLTVTENLRWVHRLANRMKQNMSDTQLIQMVQAITSTFSEVQAYKDRHKGETGFILGNGPSLREVDFDLLKDKVTFGSNRIYLSGYIPNYYVAVNQLVIEQFKGDIEDIDTIKFIPKRAIDKLSNKRGIIVPIDVDNLEPGFYSPEEEMWEGHTVTYICLQLAYYMGFEQVILLGIDHDYGARKQPNMEIIATGIDEYHFDPEYFGKGIHWHTPDLAKSELAYSLAKKAYEADERWIVNASGKTKLQVFDREPLQRVLSPIKPKVSAIVSAYKAEAYLEGCLLDLAQQSIGDDLEVVVICQSGSKEEKILYDTIAKDEFKLLTRVIYTADIPTVYKAWTLGAQNALGKYLTNANCDDRHHRRAFEIAANILDARPEIDLVYYDSYITWKGGQSYQDFITKYSEEELVTNTRWEGKGGIFNWPEYDRPLLGERCFIGPHPMWRSNLHQTYGYFLENYKSAGDYEFWLRISKENNMLHIGFPFGLYAARLDGIELGDNQTNWEEVEQAVILHQTPEFEIHDNGELARVTMADHYTLVEKQTLKRVVEKICGE